MASMCSTGDAPESNTAGAQEATAPAGEKLAREGPAMFYGSIEDEVRCVMQEHERLCKRIQLEKQAYRARDEVRAELRSDAPANPGLIGRVASAMRVLGSAHLW